MENIIHLTNVKQLDVNAGTVKIPYVKPTSPALLQSHYVPNTTVTKPFANNNPTIVIISAYDSLSNQICSDMNLFTNKFNLPQLNMQGETNPLFGNMLCFYQSASGSTIFQNTPPTNMSQQPVGSSWHLETCLDTQSAHAVAPYANIIDIYSNNASTEACINVYNMQ